MYANVTNNTNKNKITYPELSHLVTGMCFTVQNDEGGFAREKQYCDALERKLQESRVPYQREFSIAGIGNTTDFLIDDKIVLETKAKRFVTKEDYFQIRHYLQVTELKLGFLVNFRNKYIKPVRVVRIDTASRSKFA